MEKQQIWKYAGHIGDIDPIALGGGFVYTDQTGVYCPEMTYFEPGSDEQWHKLGGNTPATVYRIPLEKNSPAEFWYEKLADVARSCGQSLEDFQRRANGSVMECASVYESLVHHFGAEEFDSNPQIVTEGKLYFRYWREMHYARKAR